MYPVLYLLFTPMSSINNLESLVNEICDYEPNLVRIIFDLVFVPCVEDYQGKHKYIRAIPKPGTNYLIQHAFMENKSLEMVIVDASVKYFRPRVFWSCINLKAIILPQYLESMSNEIFYYCKSLENIKIPPTIKHIYPSTFLGASLKHIKLPNILSICEYSFSHCLLDSLTIPKSVYEIQMGAFHRCQNLVSIIFEDCPITICEYVFRNCIKLETLFIPDSVRHIKAWAFHECDNLKSVSISSNLKYSPDAFPKHTQIMVR